MPTPRAPTSDSATESDGDGGLAVDIAKHGQHISYSRVYKDDTAQYRHVELPLPLAKYLPRGRVAEVDEWLRVGITMSIGWKNYQIHGVPQTIPGFHVILFKKDLEEIKVETEEPKYPQTPKPAPGVRPLSPIVVTESETATPDVDVDADQENVLALPPTPNTPLPAPETASPTSVEVKPKAARKPRKERKEAGTQTSKRRSTSSTENAPKN